MSTTYVKPGTSSFLNVVYIYNNRKKRRKSAPAFFYPLKKICQINQEFRTEIKIKFVYALI